MRKGIGEGREGEKKGLSDFGIAESVNRMEWLVLCAECSLCRKGERECFAWEKATNSSFLCPCLVIIKSSSIQSFSLSIDYISFRRVIKILFLNSFLLSPFFLITYQSPYKQTSSFLLPAFSLVRVCVSVSSLPFDSHSNYIDRSVMLFAIRSLIISSLSAVFPLHST